MPAKIQVCGLHADVKIEAMRVVLARALGETTEWKI
jgi:hypothetical protein